MFVRNPAWDPEVRPHPQGVRRQDRRRPDREPGVDPAAAPDRHAVRRHGVGQLPAAVAAARPDRQQGPEPQPRRRPARPTRTSCSTRSRRTTAAPWASQRSARRSCTRSTATTIIQALGGPADQPSAHPRPAARASSAAGSSTPTRTTSPRPSSCSRPRAIRTGLQPEAAVPQRVRGRPEDVRDRAAGPQGGRRSRWRASPCPTPTSTRSTCRCRASRGAACGTSPSPDGDRTGTATRPCRSSVRCSRARRRTRRSGSNFGFYNNPAHQPAGPAGGVGRPRRATHRACGHRPTGRSCRTRRSIPITNPVQANYHASQVQERGLHPAHSRTSTRRTSGWSGASRAG